MKKASLHSLAAIQLAALSLLLLLLLFSSSNANANANVNVIASNATRIGDDLVGGEEFLMESETARRILAGGGRPKTVPILDRNKQFCDAKIYGSCIGKSSKNYSQRKCGYTNGCKKPDP